MFRVVYFCSGKTKPKILDLWTVRLVPVTEQSKSLFACLVLQVCAMLTSCQVAIFARLVS